MAKGILLGILMQCISAVGYMVIINIPSIGSEAFRTSLMVIFAAVVALIVAAYMAITGRQDLAAIQPREYVLVAAGGIVIMFVAQLIMFYGVSLSNMTTMALTMLAYPMIALALELAMGRIELSWLGWHDLVGFLLLAAGYVVIMCKPQMG